VVNVMVKRRDGRSRQVWIREMSANSPSKKRRKNPSDDIKTGVLHLLWEQYGRNLLTAHAMSGV
jgi:hypothetical protein